jgi:hypothetical protein
MKKVLLAIAVASIQGCTWFSIIPPEGTDHCSGWSDGVREVADSSWQYAQLSQNVYADDDYFLMNESIGLIEEFDRPDISFYAALYKDKDSGIYAFIFRGTDSFEDFKTGNNLFSPVQNKLALDIVLEKSKQYQLESFVVAGHSLGGGIATHVSLNIEGATLYTFNGSPVFKQEVVRFDNSRYSIVEKGEILKIVRLLAKEPDQLYTSIECTSGNAIEEHSMKKLATCLTRISAVNDNQEALDSLEKNNVDKKWCK